MNLKTTNFRELDAFFWFSDFLDSYSLADSKIEMCGFPKRLEQISLSIKKHHITH